MEIKKNKVVTFDYTLKDEEGNILDTSDENEPLSYLHGYDNLIPGLEKSLDKKKVGDSFKVTVTPEEGYGVYDENLLVTVEKGELGLETDIEIGSELEAHSDEGMQVFYVSKLDGDNVVLDGNHPLASKTLFFDVTVTDIRDATKEEIEHGHIHGDDDDCCE
ncbi:MAG: peptidylprolyl isomerase [Spirochaetales bacterium]|nr:peptidylprolyl isomerase [Spirochaetales bacterium]